MITPKPQPDGALPDDQQADAKEIGANAAALETATLDRLRTWADDNGVAGDPYVVTLATARERAELRALATLDPVEALPHAEPRGGRAIRSSARLFILVRNVAIFIPVALTWFGIRQATQAFGEYSERHASAPDQLNFLQFWQAGGPPGDDSFLQSEWRIQNIALVASLLILGIVLLTLVASALSAVARTRDDRDRASAERERMGIAVDLTKTLHGYREADPQTISDSLAASIGALVDASTAIGESALRLERATSGIGSMVPHIDELNRNFEHLGGQVVSQVTLSVEALGQSVSTLGTTVQKDMSASLDGAIAGLDEVREQLARTSASVEFGTKQLRDDLDAILDRLALAASSGKA